MLEKDFVALSCHVNSCVWLMEGLFGKIQFEHTNLLYGPAESESDDSHFPDSAKTRNNTMHCNVTEESILINQTRLWLFCWTF